MSPSRSGNAASLGRVLDFMRLMWAVNHGLTQVSKRMARTLGVTGPQRLVIRIVGQRPGISAGALAEVLHIHPSTLTGILQRLAAGGAIDRTRDPADTRRAILRLTPKGLEIDALRAGTVESRIRAALSSLGEEDVVAAGKVLGRLAGALSRGPRPTSQPLDPQRNGRRRPQRSRQGPRGPRPNS